MEVLNFHFFCNKILMRTKLTKIGDIIHNYTEDPKSISFIMIDTDNKDQNISKLSNYVLSNKEFASKYSIMKSKGIVKIENSYTENINLDTKIMNLHGEGYSIREVIDFIIITDKNIYVIDDISYYRDNKLKELGI